VDGERAVAEGAKEASYRARLAAPPSGAALARLALAQAGADISIVRTRKGESTDVPLGPQLRALTFDRDGNLQMTLALDAGITLRPSEVLRGLVGDEAAGVRVVRSELWVERGGRLVTPLPPA
jgi:hypothetical protein